MKYPDHDLEINSLIEGLLALKLETFETQDFLIIRLPRTITQPLLYLNQGSGYSLKQMVSEILIAGDEQLQTSYTRLMKLLEGIHTNLNMESLESEVDGMNDLAG